VRVRNINGTSIKTCQCASWLDHWRKFSGRAIPAYCAEMLCTNPAEIGAHVQKDTDSDPNWYVIPLCSAHGAKIGESISLLGTVVLVPTKICEHPGPQHP